MGKSKPQIRPKQAVRDEKGRMLPGHTINPGGRPKAAVAFREEAQKAVREGDAEGLKIINAWVSEIERHGEDWAKASELLAAYAFGKPAQGVELTGADGGPIRTSKFDLSKLSDKDARSLRDLYDKAAADK